jgi:hypothetical protein
VWELRDWLVGQWRAKGLAFTLGSPTGLPGAATSEVVETMSCTELVGRPAEVDRLAGVIFVGVPEPTMIELVQSDLPHRASGEAFSVPELVRAHLVYGEWLRRNKRCLDARAHLESAYESFTEMGAMATAERALIEPAVAGLRARKRIVDTRVDPNPQER